MTQIPEPDIDYKQLEITKVGDIFYSKPHFFRKAKWVLKLREGFIIFDNFDSAELGSLIYRRKKVKKEMAERGLDDRE